MATAYLARINTSLMNFIQKPSVQKFYKFTLLQTIELAEVGMQKGLQLYDMFPFKHSLVEIKSAINYIIKFDQNVVLSSTVKEMAVFFIVMTELIFWFFVGEIIGKRNVFGYADHKHPKH